VLLVFGGAGTIVGAWFATWLGRRGVQHPAIVVTAGGMGAAGLLLSQAGWADSPWAALAWYGPGLLCLTLPGGTAIQVIQEAVPNQLRGQASAIYYLTISVIGLSFGPLSVALLTDYVFADPLKIGAAISVVSLVIAPATALLSLSSRAPLGRMLAAGTAAPA
jgi:MFS family permease